MPIQTSWTRRILCFSGLNVLLPLAGAWVVIGWAHRVFGTRQGDADTYQGMHFGALNLVLKLSGTSSNIEEPLVTVGRPGNATFIFIRLMPEGKARLGIEFWGVLSTESEIFSLPRGRDELTLKLSFPGLYPRARDKAWDLTTESQQDFLLSHYTLMVEGAVLLRGKAPAATTTKAPIFIGHNPIGGSLVSDWFTGRVLKKWRNY